MRERELVIVRTEEQIDIRGLVAEYIQLKEAKKEIERRLEEIEGVLRPFTERNGNIVDFGYEIGWFNRRESEVSDMRRFIEIAILRGIAEKVLKPSITQIKSLRIKELLDLLVEKEKRVFSMKKLG